MKVAGREKEHEDVYGKSFALYGRRELEEFTDFFRQRFEANGLDAKSIFAGKRCMDAGCGGGRGTLFMLMNGAAHVTALDVSELNIETTAKNCKTFGFDSVTCRQTTLENIPFADGEFDFVWCNGVIMHTAHPDKCLSEITRVLKVGGQSWIYVYGAGGLYWYLVREFRRILAEVSPTQLLATLQLMGLSARYIGEYMDDWKVPYLRAYTDNEFTSRLRELGYVEPKPLLRGVSYDTSERRTVYPDDLPWYGEGDLRYFLTKGKERQPADTAALVGGGIEIEERYSADVLRRFSPLTQSLTDIAQRNPVIGVLACARIQRVLRDTMTRSGRLDVMEFESEFRSIIQQSDRAVSDGPVPA
jgi:ubiquinone/menaquinone biosynthesis C-methylase UbiE